MGAIRELSDFIHRLSFGDLPEAVIHSSKMRLLDFFGVALTGFQHGIHKPFAGVFRSDNEREESTVIGEGIRTHCRMAALINSGMCPADLTDGSRFAGLHPSAVVIPAALAIFESHGKQPQKTGKDLIAAIALGYEIMIRVGRSMNPSAVKRGFHLTPVVGPMGAAAAAGKLLSLGPSEIANSLSIACILGSGLLGAFKGSESFVGAQISRACESGIHAAFLAREGMLGYPDILETAFFPAFCDRYDMAGITQDLGKEFMIPKTYVRKHAGCRHIHAPMDAVASIVGGNGIAWTDIEHILVKTYSVAKAMEIDPPRNGDDARFNIAFGIAVSLIHGNAFYDKFTTGHLNDARVRRIMKKVNVEVSGELDKDYPSKRGTTVLLELAGGTTLTASLDFARGEPELPLSDAEIEEKFELSAGGILKPEKAHNVKKIVQRLEAEADLAELFDNLVP